MNLILPMGDAKATLSDHRFPKPMSNVLGKPRVMWILDNLILEPDDVVHIVVERDIDEQFKIAETIQNGRKDITLKVHHLYYQTRGPAESVLCALNNMDENELSRRTVCLDSDTIYFGNVLEEVRTLPAKDGACWFVHGDGRSAPHRTAFIKVAGDKGDRVVTEIAERTQIARNAILGLYAFPSGAVLLEYILLALQSNSLISTDFYLSRAITLMLEKDFKFRATEVSPRLHARLSTREDIDTFFHLVRDHPHFVQRQRFCFDLDNTLVSYPTIPGDYTSVKPIERNVRYLRELKKLGHCIVICTARRMKTHGGNVGKVLADIAETTVRSLRQFDIPYDEIIFGKPYADIYVLHGSVQSLLDPGVDLGLASIPRGIAGMEDFVTARYFNEVVRRGDTVVKTSYSETLSGEIYFYLNSPPAIKDLFPALKSVSQIAQPHSLSMQYIPGVTASHLFQSLCITPARLRQILDCLYRMHNCTLPSDHPDVNAEAELSGNYSAKIWKRYDDKRTLYDVVGISQDFVKAVTSALDESLQTFIKADVIHGDPVLTNIISTSDFKWIFVDMRGAQGGSPYLGGHVEYDLGKVFQSLCGYDFVISGKEESIDAHADYISKLQDEFFQITLVRYKGLTKARILLVTASLYLSLIPLHSNLLHQRLFASLAKDTFASYKACNC